MRIRRATPADIPAIIAIELSAGDLFVGTHMEWAVGETTSPDDLFEAIAAGNVWAAENEGLLAGYLSGAPRDGSFHIEEVAVSAQFQRQRVGERLIEHVGDEARRAGLRAITLTTDRTLPWNAPYYARLGFRIIEEAELSPALAAELAAKPNPDRRCAMSKPI